MSEESMVILTAKSADRMFEVGGTQSWVLDRVHAKRCKFAVLCQNAHSDWGDGKEPHGKAFLVGRIDDVVPSTESKDRWLVAFSEYAWIDRPETWGGWRNPVHYTTLEKLGINESELDFEPMPPVEIPKAQTQPNGTSQGLTIAQAKEGLAQTLGVSPDAVEITIRG